jgi:hypothetical protein
MHLFTGSRLLMNCVIAPRIPVYLMYLLQNHFVSLCNSTKATINRVQVVWSPVLHNYYCASSVFVIFCELDPS